MAHQKSTLRERPSLFRKTDAQQPETPKQEFIETQPEHEKKEPLTASHQERTILERTTIYLHPEQSDKLDTLMLKQKKRTGKRMNRSDIIRRLIDKYDLEEPL